MTTPSTNNKLYTNAVSTDTSTHKTQHQHVFNQIYNYGGWKTFPWTPKSGSGSSLKNTQKYRQLLTSIINNNDINKVVDFGYSDWTFSSHIDWSKVKYLGIDVTQSIVEDNQKKYRKSNIDFVCVDLTVDDNVEIRSHIPDFNCRGIPQADLWIIKDVFQHWSNAEITKFLSRLMKCKAFKWLLITNSYTKGKNVDIQVGGFRSLNPLESPLKEFNPQIVLNEGNKCVCLITTK